MNQSPVRDFVVGLFVLVGLGAIAYLSMTIGGLSFGNQGGLTLFAAFDEIGGLKPRAPVKSAGVVVGRVSDIKFDDKGYQAVVTLNLEERYKFPKDSSIKILTSGLLGEQYIGLEAGGDTEMLASGDKINMTQSAIVLENLISQFLYNKAAEGKSDK